MLEDVEGFAYRGLSIEGLNPPGRLLMASNQWDVLVWDELKNLAFVNRSSVREVSQENLRHLIHAALNCSSFLFSFFPLSFETSQRLLSLFLHIS